MDADSVETLKSIRLWMRAIHEGWTVPSVTMRLCIDKATEELSSPFPSVKKAAMDYLLECSKASMSALEKMDKMERLDAGKPTDGPQKVEVVFIDKPHAH